MKVGMLLSFLYSENMFVPPEVEMCTYLNKLGHDVHWLVASKELSGRIFRGNTVVYAIRYPFLLTTENLFLKVLRELIYEMIRMWSIYRIFKKEKYDILIARDNVFDGLVAALLKRTFKTRFILQLSNPLDQEWEGYKIEGNRPRIVYFLIAHFNRVILRLLLGQADLIVTASKWAAEDLLKYGVSQERVLTIPAGISYQRFNNKLSTMAKKYNLTGKRVILYVGSLAKIRKLEILVHAFNLLVASNSNIRLLMVGEGTGLDDLKKLTAELGLEERIYFTGFVKQDDVPEYITLADIAVCPVPPFSFYQMSSPLKLVEYMSMGKPVVANIEIPEQKEVVEHSGGGVLVNYEANAFADGINTLLEDEEKATEMGEKGRKWVLSNRTYDVLAAQLNKRLSQLLGCPQ
jgi:glycosyltransferase involved in cell wall biosynthesis